MTSVDDLLKGGGAPSLKFENVGDSHVGVIVSSEANQQTDFQSGEPKVFKNGDPMMQIVVTLLTAERDPSIEDDDGTRRFYAKGAGLTALRQAVQQAGAKTLEPGAGLHIVHSGLGEVPGKGLNAPKLFTIKLTPAGQQAVAAVVAPEPSVADLQAELEALKAGATA